MCKHFLFLLSLFIAITASAQNNAVVKGKIVDSLSKTPVEFATVAILDVKDTTSSLVSYMLSDKKGDFILHNLPAGRPLKILISFVAYNSYRKFFTLGKGETLDLGVIAVSAKQLNEVVIRGERAPVVVRKDTIEFNAEAFKTRPNALVEELLKKLPGMEVDAEGSISFNGKAVAKVLVDGHEFFNNDYRIATKNLDAEMIDKVQVYNDRENDPNHLTPDSRAAKIINLKFKKKYKKSVFGKATGGDGTAGRYTASGLVNMFRDTLQISVLGQGNNLNNTGFSFDDLFTSGGFNRGPSDAFSRGGLSPFGGLGGGNAGIQKVLAGGVNINTDYGKKLKINLAYYYSSTTTTYNSVTNRQTFLNDTNFTNNTIGLRSQTTEMHNVTASIVWRPDTVTQITYRPAFSYSDNRSNGSNTVNSFNNFIPEIARSTNTDNNSGNNLQFEQSVEYNHQLKKEGESLSISHSFQVNPGNSNAYSINDLTSYTTGLSSYLLNRNTSSVNRSISGDIGISYRYPLSKKIAIGVGVTGDYNHQVNNTLTYDIDPSTGQYDIFLQNVSSNLTRNLSTENINPSLTYNFNPATQLVLGANTRVQQVNNRFDRNLPEIDQHFITFLPSVNLNIGNVSIGYHSDFNLPNIGDMIPYSVVFNPLFSVTGNPDLKPTKSNSFNLGYNTYKYQSQISIGMNVNASFEQNSIFRQTTINSVGAETSTPINMNGSNLIKLDGHFNKRFKKHNNLEFSTSTNLSATSSRGFFEVNHQDGYQTTYNAALKQSFSVNWNDIINVEQTYRLTNSVTKYSGINYSNQTYITHMADTHFNIFWPKKINIEGTYTYTYNPMVSPGFQKSANLLNLSIAHALLKKDKGEIKLSCYDILNKNISSSRYVNANTITDMQSQVLKRYFLVTLLFKFNKSLSK